MSDAEEIARLRLRLHGVLTQRDMEQRAAATNRRSLELRIESLERDNKHLLRELKAARMLIASLENDR